MFIYLSSYQYVEVFLSYYLSKHISFVLLLCPNPVCTTSFSDISFVLLVYPSFYYLSFHLSFLLLKDLNSGLTTYLPNHLSSYYCSDMLKSCSYYLTIHLSFVLLEDLKSGHTTCQIIYRSCYCTGILVYLNTVRTTCQFIHRLYYLYVQVHTIFLYEL